MKKIAIIGVAVLVVVTFLAGFWPHARMKKLGVGRELALDS